MRLNIKERLQKIKKNRDITEEFLLFRDRYGEEFFGVTDIECFSENESYDYIRLPLPILLSSAFVELSCVSGIDENSLRDIYNELVVFSVTEQGWYELYRRSDFEEMEDPFAYRTGMDGIKFLFRTYGYGEEEFEQYLIFEIPVAKETSQSLCSWESFSLYSINESYLKLACFCERYITHKALGAPALVNINNARMIFEKANLLLDLLKDFL